MRNLSLLLFALALMLVIYTISQALPMVVPGVREARSAAAWAQAEQEKAKAKEASARADAYAANAQVISDLLVVALAAVVAIGAMTAAFLGMAWGRRAWIRATWVAPDKNTALYPVVGGVLLNEPGAQTFATLSVNAGHLRAPVVRALANSFNPANRFALPAPPPETPVLIPDGVLLPDKASIYQAPNSGEALPVGVGGEGPVTLELHNLGNVLVGGLPGYGKSELLGAMMVHLSWWSQRGHRAKIAVIDTKRVDFGVLPDDLAVLFAPVAKEVSDGRRLIAEVLAECQRRFELLEAAHVRDLRSYNAAQPGRSIPYLVVFLDEIADWTLDKQFVAAALEVGRKGRAAGVSLVMATQSPTTDVIESRLRAIAGVQIAFRTRDRHGSTALLGTAGAEQLPADRPGRCLVARGEIVRAQAYFAGLRTGEFDNHFAHMARRSEPWPVRELPSSVVPVPGVPVPGNGGNGYYEPAFSQEQEQERRWDAFLAQAIEAGSPKSPSFLARLMAKNDGRPDDYSAYKSIAWRFLNS